MEIVSGLARRLEVETAAVPASRLHTNARLSLCLALRSLNSTDVFCSLTLALFLSGRH